VRAPLVSFVVLNWRNEASTRGCIETILRQRRDVEKEIVVVDNESTAETRARLAGGRWRLIALDENRGFTGGMNAGAAATRGASSRCSTTICASPTTGWIAGSRR